MLTCLEQPCEVLTCYEESEAPKLDIVFRTGDHTGQREEWVHDTLESSSSLCPSTGILSSDVRRHASAIVCFFWCTVHIVLWEILNKILGILHREFCTHTVQYVHVTM